jgi:hypothetical protein
VLVPLLQTQRMADRLGKTGIQTVKTCQSCAHYLHSLTKAGDYQIMENRCAIKLMDPVTGLEGEPECAWARTWPHHCGWEGRWWQPAKAKPLPGLGG